MLYVHRIVADFHPFGGRTASGAAISDGRDITRAVGYAIVHAAGRATNDDVVFAEPGDMVLLGARSLEGLNLRVDSQRK